MSPDEQARALERAATPALAAIDDDSGRAPRWLRPLFAAIRELLFEPDLDLDQILEAAGFADPEVWSAVREVVGQPAWSYLRDARLETAALLLLETGLSIAEVGYLVGYGCPPSFRRLLRSFLGQPPSEYRKRAKRRLAAAGTPPSGAESGAYWRRLLAGELSAGEARELDAYLGRLAPASAPPAATDEARRDRLHRSCAEGLARVMEQLPYADQRRFVRDAVRFPDGAPFELLSRRGLEAGETDPERGVELAQLAIDALESGGLLAGDPERAALARERLEQARRRAGETGCAR